MKTKAVLAIGLICLAGSGFDASASPKTNVFKRVLSTVAAAELPARAATLVKAAKATDRENTTTNVVTAALEVNPTAAPSIVGAISRAVPEMAPLAAATAATAQPKMASIIAMAAASAAPSQTRKIVSAVCRAVPSEYANVANAMAKLMPAADREILSAVSDAFPALKSSVDRAFAENDNKVPAVGPVISQLVSNPRGPTVGPPYIPLSGTPSNVTPADTGTVPPGGRGYAAP